MFPARVAIPLIFNQLGLVLSSRPQDEYHVPTHSLGQISHPYPLPSTKRISLPLPRTSITSLPLTCDQASLYFRGGKVRLIQLLDYLSVASPESRHFSDWSRNKRYLELSH